MFVPPLQELRITLTTFVYFVPHPPSLQKLHISDLVFVHCTPLPAQKLHIPDHVLETMTPKHMEATFDRASKMGVDPQQLFTKLVAHPELLQVCEWLCGHVLQASEAASYIHPPSPMYCSHSQAISSSPLYCFRSCRSRASSPPSWTSAGVNKCGVCAPPLGSEKDSLPAASSTHCLHLIHPSL